MATCRYCGQKAGFLRKQHGQCRDLHATGIREVTQLAAQAAGTSGFSRTALRSTLRAIANRAQATEDDTSQAIADGWAQGVQHAMQDGILTRQEETNLRDFRDRMDNQDLPGIITGPPPSPGHPRPGSPPWQNAPPSRPTTAGRPSRRSITPCAGPAFRTQPAGSSSPRPGSPPSRVPWRTASSPWTRRTP